MTSTLGINSAAGNQATPSSSGGASVDYDAFLRLLVTQLKNQDPTKPMDSEKYLSQLATFSQVEQSIMANNKLDELLSASAVEQANELIGRTVTSADGETSGEVASVRITSGGLVAKLQDGSELPIGPGVVVS